MAQQDRQLLYTRRLEWSGQAHSSVICTGDFDEWKGTQPLNKDNASGKWVADVKLPYGQKEVKYKFLVDGTWQHATDQQYVNDDAGNTNNVFTVPEAPSQEELAAAAAAEESTAGEDSTEKSLTTATTTSELSSDPERDIPKTIQDLFSNSSDNFLGPGIVGNAAQQNGNGQGGRFSNHPGFMAYSVANFGITKHLEPLQVNYPSRYLLQGGGDSTSASTSTSQETLNGGEEVPKKNEEITPSDVQIATEFIIAKYKSVHAQAQHRINVEKEIKEEKKLREKNEREGVEDKKLLEIEEGSSATTESKEQQNGEEQVISPSSSSSKTKTKTLPPIQVPGFAKIYSLIKENHPNWVFSEKRLRKIIKEGEDAAASSTPSSSSSSETNGSDAPKESAMLEADRIVKLSGLIKSGKYFTELVPVSRFDYVLQQELDDQWAATNGLPLPSSSQATSPSSQQPSASTSAPLTNGNSDNKENEEPSTAASSGKNKKKKSKASSSVAETASAVVNGIAEGAESLVNKVASSLPSSSSTPNNAVASSSSSASSQAALAALTSAPTKRNPTNAVGDVALKWYGPIKGRGVVARRSFKKGSVIFREDAFAFAPTKTIQTAINEGRGCAFCGKLFSSKAQSLVVPCTAHDHLPTSSASARKVSSSGGAKKVSATGKSVVKKEAEGEQEKVEEEENRPKKVSCNNKYCNKLCKERATETYANLLCPIVNPSFSTFMKWAETADPRSMKMNPTGVFYIMLRLIVAASKPTPGAAEEALELMRRIECLAAVNERARRSQELGVLADMQYGHDWVLGYRFVMEALQLPDKYYKPAHTEVKPEETPASENEDEDRTASSSFFPGHSLKRSEQGGINALPEWYRNLSLPEEMEAKLLGFDNYLVWLGRVALNQEDDGGIYMLHPCMNHECAPNATVRRTPAMSGAGAREAKPSRIFVLANRDIEEGEEITVMYVNPSPHVVIRQQMLKTDYLFECSCGMCKEQLAEHYQSNKSRTNNNAITQNGEADTSNVTADTSVTSSVHEDDINSVYVQAFRAPPGATVDENYVLKKMMKSPNAATNGSNGHVNGNSDNHESAEGGEDGESAPAKLSAATLKKKKKKAALKLRQEQEAAEAAAKAHALDPMGFFKNDKPSTPWYEEDDI